MRRVHQTPSPSISDKKKGYNMQTTISTIEAMIMNRPSDSLSPSCSVRSSGLLGCITGLLLASLLILFSFNSYAQTSFSGSLNSVSITDAAASNAPPSANFSHQNTDSLFTFDATSSYDSDGSIVEYKWDFGDGNTALGPVVSHTYTELSSAQVTLTLKDNNGGISIIQRSVSLLPPATTVTPIDIAVNFQPTNSIIPKGFVVDDGSAYSDQRGFGWTSPPNSVGTRDRANSLSPDQSYDTLIHLAPSAVWEYKLENGVYNITIVMGDPSYWDTTHAAQMENQEIIPPTVLNSDQRWIKKEATVEVKDMRLTVSFVGSSIAKLCWVRISNI